MKRPMLGGAHRGPVAPSRQRRTIRLVQILLVAIAVGLLVSAGFAWRRIATFEVEGRASFDRPRRSSAVQPVVLVLLSGASLAAATALGGRTVRLPTPARLDELVGRAEGVAIERAERSAASTGDG